MQGTLASLLWLLPIFWQVWKQSVGSFSSPHWEEEACCCAPELQQHLQACSFHSPQLCPLRILLSLHRITANSYSPRVGCDCSNAHNPLGSRQPCCWSHSVSAGRLAGQHLSRQDGCAAQLKETQRLPFQRQEKWSRKKDEGPGLLCGKFC